jgi:hypothetical protein
VGFSRKRIGSDGKPRYTATYRDARGKERSAGTFPTKKLADSAWQRAEAGVDGGPEIPARAGSSSRATSMSCGSLITCWKPLRGSPTATA